LLLNSFRRLGDSKVYFRRVGQNPVREGPYLRWHSRRKQECLALLGKVVDNADDVAIKTHIEHSVCLVQHEVLQMIEVEGSRGEQRDQAAGGGDNNIGARLECLFLFIPCGPIAPTVYGDRAYSHKISEALNLLVDLLGKFTGW